MNRGAGLGQQRFTPGRACACVLVRVRFSLGGGGTTKGVCVTVPRIVYGVSVVFVLVLLLLGMIYVFGLRPPLAPPAAPLASLDR